jgi:HD-GYP domain-containing protein (c-di-GMP phosphodiesterase class II)
MTSDRPYRDSIGRERAIDELLDGAGTQFDPDVVDVFVSMIEAGPDEDDDDLAAVLALAV